MKSSELKNILSQRLGIPQTEVQKLLQHTAISMARLLESGIGFTLPKLGTFSAHTRAERVSYHPGLKSKVILPIKKTILFKPATVLKIALKQRIDGSPA